MADGPGAAGLTFIPELPVFIPRERRFLQKQTRDVILLHDSLSPEPFPGLIWRREVVLQVPDHHLLPRSPLPAFCPCVTPRSHRGSPPPRPAAPPAQPLRGWRERDAAWPRWQSPLLRPGGSSCPLAQPTRVTLGPRSVPRPGWTLQQATRCLVCPGLSLGHGAACSAGFFTARRMSLGEVNTGDVHRSAPHLSPLCRGGFDLEAAGRVLWCQRVTTRRGQVRASLGSFPGR